MGPDRQNGAREREDTARRLPSVADVASLVAHLNPLNDANGDTQRPDEDEDGRRRAGLADRIS